MTVSKKDLTVALLAAAAVCFVVALLISVNLGIHHGNEPAWKVGGLLALALAFLSEQRR